MRVRVGRAIALMAVTAACTPTGGGGGGGGGGANNPPPKEYVAEPQQMPPGPSAEGLTLLDSVDFTTPSVPFQTVVASGSFVPGKWSSGNGTYSQDEPGSSMRLSIRSYTGNVPSRYRVQVTGWTYRVFTSDPAKDQGVTVLMPFYVDPTHYVIGSTSPNVAEVWACDGQRPGESWPPSNKLWGQSFTPPRTVGQATTWTYDVDVPGHSMTIYLDGDKKATVMSPVIDGSTYTVALASNGSQVRYANFRLWRLAGASDTPAPPGARPTPAPRTQPAPALTPAPAAGSRSRTVPTPTEAPLPAPLPEAGT